MRHIQLSFFLTVSAALSLTAADETASRLNKAVNVLNTMTDSKHGIRPDQLASADCIAVIPGFKKGAAVVGVGYGRGYISCRSGDGWSSPGAVTLESGSVGVQLGGEEINIVILSRDKQLRSRLLGDRFAFGSDASAAWGNGGSAHGDPDAKVIFYGQTKGAFAGFGLDGATLKRDQDGNQALYGSAVSNSTVVDGGTNTPAAAKSLIATLDQTSKR